VPYLEITWNTPAKIAVVINSLLLLVGIVYTELNILIIVAWSISSLLLILMPWLWRWYVPRKRFFEPAPESTVLVWGWFGIICNLIYVFFNING
jgi:hypothetical protein